MMWPAICCFAEEAIVEEFQYLTEADNEIVHFPVSKDDMPARLGVRRRIEALEDIMRQYVRDGDLDEVDCQDENLTHYFIDGVYARELFIPAGTAVIGRIHKYPRICIISQGDVSFVTEFGSRRVVAPFTEVMQPGTKTAVYAHTDTTWTAILGTHETDVKKIEEIFVCDSHAELPQMGE